MPGLIVVDPPGPDDAPGIIQPVEQVLVQALVPQAAVEALDNGVLGRLARRDISGTGEFLEPPYSLIKSDLLSTLQPSWHSFWSRHANSASDIPTNENGEFNTDAEAHEYESNVRSSLVGV